MKLKKCKKLFLFFSTPHFIAATPPFPTLPCVSKNKKSALKNDE